MKKIRSGVAAYAFYDWHFVLKCNILDEVKTDAVWDVIMYLLDNLF